MSLNYLAVLYSLPALISLAVGAVLWRHRRTEGQTFLALLMFSTVFWSGGYSLELASSTYLLKDLWGLVQYLGIASAATLFFLTMLYYAGLETRLTWRTMGALWVVPVLTVVLRITNPWHGLVHRSSELQVSGSFVFLSHHPGPWFWVVIGYSYLMLWGGVILLWHFRLYARVMHRRQMALLAAGSLAPLAGSLAYITGHRPLGYVDLTPMGFSVTGLTVAWGAVRNRVFELMPVARTALVDGFPDGLLMLDLRGRIADMNATAGHLLGLDVATAVGTGIERALADWPALLDLCRSKSTRSVEFDGGRAGDDAPPPCLEARLSCLRGRGDEVMAYLVVLSDISERKQAEEERARLGEQLRQAQKMEAVGQLAGGVAHDFNNLLQVINGYVRMALEDLAPDHPIRDMLEEVSKAGQRSARLVSQLLAFSRRQTINPEKVDLNELVPGLLKLLRRVIGEHIRVDFVPSPLPVLVFGDRNQLEQVLVNLSVNARDAMPDGGTLTIAADLVQLDEDYCVMHPWAKPGDFVVLRVTDTGCGMDAETAQRVFDPFFTTKEVGKGTGLGLATVYGIVKQHEGMITVDTEQARGTTFKVYLSAAEGEMTLSATPPETAPAGGTETILVVEDEPAVRNLSCRTLEKAGYRVMAAENGAEALRICDEHGAGIDLVVLDIVMPVMGGRATCERLRERFPRMRFLFASGYDAEATHSNFVLNEGFELVRKPFSANAILLKVRQLLDRT